MSPDDYNELVRQSTRGDDDATKKLFSLGEERASAGDFLGASEAFKDAAIAYRIARSREKGSRESSQNASRYDEAIRDMYRDWIVANPHGAKPLPIDQQEAGWLDRFPTTEFIDLAKESPFDIIYYHLENELSRRGVEFFSPGGSIQRRVSQIAKVMIGMNVNAEYSQLLGDIEIRVPMDLIVDEVTRRAESSDSGVGRYWV
jgi:hypothetical protein